MHKGNVRVVGDAFHPMIPDIGQGACSALKDAAVLARCIVEALKMSTNDTQAQREKEEERYERINKVLEYANVGQWRSFFFATTSYMTDKLQQSIGEVVGFLREKFLSRFWECPAQNCRL